MKVFLYIGDRRADLNDQAIILFNYTMEDLRNPTTVKNSYTQQVTLPGTPANDDIFGNIYRSDRQNQAGGGTGVNFNPTVRTPFTIYDETFTVLETGYLKLDKISRKGQAREYVVTLYGYLGAFLYGLAFRDDGGKKTLADLKFTGASAGDDELDFTINAQAVLDAWKRLAGDTSVSALWDILNFIPAYNGLPTGAFDANKAISRPGLNGLTIPAGHTAPNGWTLCNLARKFTEWEVKDLRSYLQKPCIKFSKILEAICAPYNNGGYTINLDSSFFSQDNPYYAKAWMTLPAINTISLPKANKSGRLTPAIGSNVSVPDGGDPNKTYDVEAYITPSTSLTGTRYYMHTYDRVDRCSYLNYLTYTLRAYDSSNNLVSETSANVSTMQTPEDRVQMDYVGGFDPSTGVWEGDRIVLAVSGRGISYVRLTVTATAITLGPESPGYTTDARYMWTITSQFNPHYTATYGQTLDGAYRYQAGESIRSGAKITKAMLLSSDKTPVDYLLAFCKMFGLVITVNPWEKTVDIMTRDAFYNGDVIDLTGMIDEGETAEIVPIAFDSAFYKLQADYDNGEAAQYYRNMFSETFGSQRINTGYQFGGDEKDLLEGSKFKGGCEVLETSSCFVSRYGYVGGSQVIYPAAFQEGGTYILRDGNGKDVSFPLPLAPGDATILYNNQDYPYCDSRPKLQFHNTENAQYFDRDTLVFHQGLADTSTYIQLEFGVTDDTQEMLAANGGTPCWILNYGRYDQASRPASIPVFSRYLYDGTMVKKSWDFGTPKEVQIPGITFAGQSSVYDYYWRKYISDRYDDDSRVMTVKVNLGRYQVGEALFRNFYFYENALWVLNKIINHSITTYGPTECEFIRVQDKQNYTDK